MLSQLIFYFFDLFLKVNLILEKLWEFGMDLKVLRLVHGTGLRLIELYRLVSSNFLYHLRLSFRHHFYPIFLSLPQYLVLNPTILLILDLSQFFSFVLNAHFLIISVVSSWISITLMISIIIFNVNHEWLLIYIDIFCIIFRLFLFGINFSYCANLWGDSLLSKLGFIDYIKIVFALIWYFSPSTTDSSLTTTGCDLPAANRLSTVGNLIVFIL